VTFGDSFVEEITMTDVQRFRLAPVTLSSMFRYFETFPLSWIVLPVPLLLLGFGAAGFLVPEMRMPWLVAGVLCVGGLILPVFMAGAVLASRLASIEINGGHLVVRGVLLGPSARLQVLRLSDARAVDLRRDRTYRPVAGGGINMPGYCAGSGSIGGGEKADWLLTDTSRVLYVPARSGRSLLISAESPEAIVETLHSMPVPADA
jgi:hypothetical protein